MVKNAVAKRHTKQQHTDIMLQITKPAIKRVAQRAGVKRLRSVVYKDARDMLKAFLTKVVRDARLYTNSRNRVTTNCADVSCALENNNCSTYSYLK